METSVPYETVSFKIDDSSVEIYACPNSFRPNRVSEAFISSLPEDLSGKVVYDIGAGSGVIAIAEALRNAKIVHAVEPAQTNYELLVANIKKLGLEDKIIPYQGKYFDPLGSVEYADVISADVSGIPDVFGRALGWYPQGVDTGGKEGYEITCELLKRAPEHIKDDGMLLFPTAKDLLDAEVILEAARNSFGRIENALCSKGELEEWGRRSEENGKMWKSPEYVWFQLREQDMKSVHEAYSGELPDTMNIQKVRGRNFWRGQIHRATKPLSQ